MSKLKTGCYIPAGTNKNTNKNYVNEKGAEQMNHMAQMSTGPHLHKPRPDPTSNQSLKRKYGFTTKRIREIRENI